MAGLPDRLMPRFVLKMISGLALVLLCLLTGHDGRAQAQYDCLASWEVEAAEYEALVEALDEFGLILDSHELKGMDSGDIWSYIERRLKEDVDDRQVSPKDDLVSHHNFIAPQNE